MLGDIMNPESKYCGLLDERRRASGTENEMLKVYNEGKIFLVATPPLE